LSRPQKLSEVELAELARLGSPLIDALGTWLNRRLSCAHCKRCTRRCEILEQPALDIGGVEADFAQIVDLAPDLQNAAVLRLVQERPELYHTLRRCCFCGHCTATCATSMTAAARMREWREPFMAAGLMPPDDSKLVMVDNEWHIFSAYRAIYGIAYPEFTQLADAAAGSAATGGGKAASEATVNGTAGGANADDNATIDTLFFPGCSLVSYAPELMRRIGRWLDAAGYRWAMSVECCGSPLMSAGLFERSRALRQKLLDQIRAVGVTRVLTVCPGCGEELAEVMGDEVDIVPLPELLLEHLTAGDAAVPGDGLEPQDVPFSMTFFDSCHDRLDTRHGTAVRRLLEFSLPKASQVEMPHHGKDTLCCGAGGAVAAYDAEITQRRVWRVIDEARATKAGTLVTICPTCTYTIAQALLGAASEQGIQNHNYLELAFGQTINWPEVFGQLEAMWTGEYAPWLTQTFF
jgi:Fe-S oxidoreductase